MIILSFDKNFSNNRKTFINNRLHEIASILSTIGGIVGSIGEFLATPVSLAGTQIGTIGSILKFVISIALNLYSSISSAISKSESYHSLDENGQLVNTRQSGDPVRVLYGRCKTGGTWTYSKSSAWNNTVLNTIVTWGEGEITGVGTAIDSSVIFSGTTTLNDLETSGTFVAPAA